MIDRRLFVFPLLMMTMLLASCASLSKEYPDIRMYSLDPVRTAPVQDLGMKNGVLVVRSFTASPACAEASFLLRRNGSEVEKDYYNRFVVPPSDLVQDAIASWLRESGVFADVRSTPAVGASKWVMRGHIVRLEGDFSSKPAAAVMELQLMVGPAPKEEGETFFRTYSERIDLESSSSEALVEGWNKAFAVILGKVEEDLATKLPE